MTYRNRIPTAAMAAMLLATVGCTEDSSPLDLPSAAGVPRFAGATVQHVATTEAPILVSIDGVDVYNSGYGSGMAMVPGSSRQFYLLTDRGPNVDGNPNTIKKFPDPTYSPRIYRAGFSGSKLRIEDQIILRRPDGTPLTGLPIGVGQCGSTLEIAQTLDGTVIPADPYGLDAEGIVAMTDGTFWISDEYGPFIAHYAADGREIERLSPCNGGIPEVYRLRRPNRGMEGLTLTPDGEWLVGIMQAPLENPSPAGVRNISRATRILFRHMTTGETREYLYLLDAATLQGNSEILALSATRFLVIERDGLFLGGTPAAAMKKIYEIDITGATDISTAGALGATPISGRTLEQATVTELAAAGFVPVTKKLAVDLVALGYPHDKPEGLALAPGGMLFVVNDDDFGVVSQDGGLGQKILPTTGRPDGVAVWQIRLP